MHNTLSRMIIRMAGRTKARTAKGILQAIRASGLPKITPEQYRPRVSWLRIPVEDRELSAKARYDAWAVYRRKQNWGEPFAVCSREVGQLYVERGFRYNGRHSGRTGSYAHPIYASYWELAKRGKVLRLWQEVNRETKLVLERRAPRNCVFAQDDLGIYFRDEKSRDNHFTVEDFKSRDFIGRMRRSIRDKITAKRKQSAETKNRDKAAAILDNPEKLARVWVSVVDSLTAGNCLQGTLAFSRRFGFDPDKIGAVRADALLSLSPSDGRVRAAIVAACLSRSFA